MSLLLAASIVAVIFIIASMSKPGHALGLNDEHQLVQCPTKPNCVSSEYPDDIDHYLEAVTVPLEISNMAMSIVKQAIEDLGGHIQTENADYIAATFSSRIFGFIDDIEYRFDREKQLIHFRSAARTGYSDFSVNENRMLQLKKIILQKLEHPNNATP